MNDTAFRFATLLPKWVSTTHDSTITFPFTQMNVSAAADVLSQHLLDGTMPAGNFDSSAGTLTSLSILCGRLNIKTPSDAVLLEAEKAFDLASTIVLNDDPLGEIPEVLCHLSYIAWRACRNLGLPIAAAKWQISFEKSLGRDSAFRMQCSSLLGAIESAICEPSDSRVSACVADPLILFGICSLLRERRDGSPGHALRFARRIHEHLRKMPTTWSPVERLFFLGETALIASGSARLCGEIGEAFEWLTVAQADHRELPQPDDLVAAILYTRITIAFESTDYAYVLTRIDDLVEWYRRAGLRRCVGKSLYLKGDVLKLMGKIEEAEQAWRSGLEDLGGEHDLRAAMLGRMGELRTIRGEFDEALDFLIQARAITDEIQMPMVSGNIEVMFGELNRQQERWDEALQFFYRGLADFARVDMKAMVARVRVHIAEALLASGEIAKAEKELRALLPELIRRRLIPESLAAFALLREAVTQRAFNH